jgi:hypothetical protein
MHYKLAQLILTPGRRSSTVSEIYLAQPDAIKEALAGKLFMLIEVGQNSSDSLKVVNFLIDNVNYNYYQNEKIYLREKISSLTVEHIFEGSLAKTNKNFLEYIEKERIKIDLRLVNVTVGVLHENMIYLANAGRNKSLLIYKSKTKPVESNGDDANGEFKIIDIVREDKNRSKTESITNKFFSNVISGQIPGKGSFLFTNEALPEYISNSQLIQIITTLPPLSAVEQIKGLLTKINSYVSFLGIIIKSTALEKTEDRHEPIPAVSTQESIEQLNRTEESTENLLAPTGIVDSKKFLDRFTPFFPKVGKKTKLFSSQASLQDKILMKKKNFGWLGEVSTKIKNTAIHLVNLLFYLFKFITSKEKVATSIATAETKTFKYFGNLKISLSSLNRISKSMLIIAVICLIVFTGKLVYSSYQNKINVARQNYTNLVTQIEQKQNQIDGYLLYNNEDGAKVILNEISSLLKTFPQTTVEQKTKYQAISTKISGQLEQVRKIFKINDATELADFTKLYSNAQPENLIYLPDLKKMYVADSSQKSIYIFDLDKKLGTKLADLTQPPSFLLHPTATKDDKIYFLDSNNFLVLDAKKETATTINLPATTKVQDVIAAQIYNSKFYLLNPKDSQIFKYDQVGNTLANQQNWLTEKIDLSTAVDLSIDGNVYALTSNGQMIKMLKGKQVNYNLTAVDPIITQATKMFMSPDQKYVYILEPAQQRLVVYDKNGNLVIQYRSDQWQNLKDLAVDEKNKIIYLLNDKSILEFPTRHIK